MAPRSNVTVVRSAMDAMKRDDADAMRALAHPDYEFQTTSALPGAGIYKGLESVMAFNRQFNDTWETFAVEEQRVIDSDEQVVILGRVKATGRASGVALETSVAYVHSLQAGRLVRTRVFFDHAAAMRAAGLAESR